MKCPECEEPEVELKPEDRMKNIWVQTEDGFDLWYGYECPQCGEFIALKDEIE